MDVAVEKILGEIISSKSKSSPQLWPVKLKKLCSFWMENDFSSCLKTLSQTLMGLALKGVRAYMTERAWNWLLAGSDDSWKKEVWC